MSHTIEAAASGRAKCRGCGQSIKKGELRLGDRQPNPFADEGEMTLWFHLACGAYKRPESFLDATGATDETIADEDELTALAQRGVEHERLARLDGAERAPTARATCRHCREKITKGAWRIRLVFFDDGRFQPAGFVHAECATAHFGATPTIEHVACFSKDRSAEELEEVRDLIG